MIFFTGRWASFCQDHAPKRIHYHDWPFPRKVRSAYGCIAIYPRTVGRGILVWCHLVSSWCHCQCRYRLGSLHFCRCFCVYCYFLHVDGWIVLCGLHWRYTTHLHLCWIGECGQQSTVLWHVYHIPTGCFYYNMPCSKYFLMNCQSKPEIVPMDVYGLNFTVTGLSFRLFDWWCVVNKLNCVKTKTYFCIRSLSFMCWYSVCSGPSLTPSSSLTSGLVFHSPWLIK